MTLEIHRTQLNDEITVKHPPLGTEWRLDVINQATAYKPVIGFKLSRLVPTEFLFMLAKDYMVPPANVVTAKELVSEIYPASYAKQFTKVDIASISDLGDGWWIADYHLEHVKAGAIHKRERVKTVREHVILTSAEGWPDAMQTHAEAVAAWMTSTFAPLDR